MYYLIAFIMGLGIAMQAPLNSTLSRALNDSSILSAMINFVIGALFLAVLAYCSGALHFDTMKALPQQSWWKFLGGVLGAFYIFGTILLAPKIGLINMFSIALVGQLVMSMILDSIGAFGLSVRPISWQKVVGLLIMCVGLFIFFSKEFKSA